MGILQYSDLARNMDQEDAVHLILISIALEAIALAHVLNAQGEKMQRLVEDQNATIEDLLTVDDNIDKTLRNVIRKDILLQFKLEDALETLEIDEEDDDEI